MDDIRDTTVLLEGVITCALCTYSFFFCYGCVQRDKLFLGGLSDLNLGVYDGLTLCYAHLADFVQQGVADFSVEFLQHRRQFTCVQVLGALAYPRRKLSSVSRTCENEKNHACMRALRRLT